MQAPFDTAQRGHHPDSPSSLQSTDACSHFENEQRESAASTAGTLQHKSTETRDLTILDTEEQVAAVQRCLDYEDRILAMYRLQEAEHTGEAKELFAVSIEAEQYLAVGDDIADVEKNGFVTGAYTGITGGFPDKVIRNQLTADILDWKFGKVPVTPTAKNLQGISYALGAFQKWKTLGVVAVHFYAPYQGWSSDEQQEKYVHFFKREEVPELELWVRTVVARKKTAAKQRLQNDWSLATPKTDLCLWCAHKGDCHKNLAIFAATSSKHRELVVPETIDALALSRPDQFKAAFRFANQVEAIAKGIKKRCTDAFLTEDLDLGDDFKITRRVERSVTSVQGVIETAIQHGLTREEIVETMTVPITKVEEAIKAKAEKGQGAAAIRAFKADLEEAGITVPGTPTYFLQEIRSPAERKNQVIEV